LQYTAISPHHWTARREARNLLRIQTKGVADRVRVVRNATNLRDTMKKEILPPQRGRHKGPFTRRGVEYSIPCAFVKSPMLETYDGTANPDEHVEHLDTVLDYHCARGVVKYKLFVLMMKGAAMGWFKGLWDNSIDSSEELCSKFTFHFTARRRHPKTMAALIAIIQDKKETLREYVEQFTWAGVEVSGAHDGVKCFTFKDCKFREKLRLRAAKDMNNLLTRAQPYINYEEKKLVEEALKRIQSYKSGNDDSRNDDEKTKGSRPYPRDYTLLNTRRETILREYYATEFRAASIKAPQSLKESARTDKMKYCSYHRSWGHDTEECFQLRVDKWWTEYYI